MWAKSLSPSLLHGKLTGRIIIAFFEVYNELGHGFLEVVYHAALARALRDHGLHVDREVPIDVFFRQIVIGRFHADLVVEARVVGELKAVRRILPEHEAQLLHYLRATAMEVGLVLNFGPRPDFKRLIYSNSMKQPRYPR
ncbi:MAG TPA: GxxExxY protein [Gemmatimonadaceae bacterium]|nr:GxxExxY protein [Gemmatimonadaceae bacterium]